MKKYITAITLLLLGGLLPVTSASAHVFVRDQSNQNGVILHITPDDDPIAGIESTLYFDAQQNVVSPVSAIAVTVEDSDGHTRTVKTTADKSFIRASYVFPNQGVYTLRLIITTNTRTVTFVQAQRVSHGVLRVGSKTTPQTWAEALLILCVIGFGCMVIVVCNNRKDIARQSTFIIS